MSNQIKNRIQECSVCAKFGASQPKPEMRSHAIPVHPFQLASMDVFFQEFQGKQRKFLVTVDHYSDYFELDILKDMTPHSVIEACKRNFARHGTPQLIVTDNGANFVNEEMVAFSKSWGFKHTTSAPYHQQANGKSEAAVKISKHLIKKAKESGQDLWFVLQHWRNIPNKIGSSPANRLFSRSIRCGIPIPVTNLLPKVVDAVPDSIIQNRQKIKYQYDRRTRHLPSLQIGSPVYVQLRPDTSKLWTPGVLNKKLNDRSYLVDVGDVSYRRDAVNVKPRNEPVQPLTNKDPDPAPAVPSRPIPEIDNGQLNAVQPEGSEMQPSHPETLATRLPDQSNFEAVSSPQCPPVDPVRVPHPTTERPKRSSRIPAKYKDYVMN